MTLIIEGFKKLGHDTSDAIVKLLVENGADVNLKSVNLKSTNGILPLLAVFQRDVLASRQNDISTARLLIEHGADVNALSEWSYGTPLNFAVGHSLYEKIQLLLDSNVDVNLPGTTPPFTLGGILYRTPIVPLTTAVLKADDRSIELLLANGAVLKTDLLFMVPWRPTAEREKLVEILKSLMKVHVDV